MPPDESIFGRNVRATHSPTSPPASSKARNFADKLQKEINSPLVGGLNLARGEIQLTVGALQALKVTDPKKAGVFVTSMMVQKAMLAAGITSDEEKRNCAEALGNLAADFGLAATLGPETMGMGAILPLAAALLDSYDMTNTCFHLKGGIAHAVVAPIGESTRKQAESAEKVSGERAGRR